MEANTQQKPEGRALTPQQQKAKSIQSFLTARSGAFADLLPKALTPEKMVKGVMAAATRSPRILECTQGSILNAVLIASSLGLEIGRPRGGMYLVPFRNNKAPGRPYEAVAVPDYRGLMDLAFRSGRVRSIEARAVYDKDHFDFAYGTESFVKHVPTLRERGDLRCVYAVAHVDNTRPVFVVLSMEEIEKEHRAHSRAKDAGPWADHYVAMCLKTAVKVLTNWLPQAQDDLLTRAVEYDSRVDAGEGIADLFDVIEIEGEEVEPSQTEKVTQILKEGQKQNDAGGGEQESATPHGDPAPSPASSSDPAGGESASGKRGSVPVAPSAGPHPEAPTSLPGKRGPTSEAFRAAWKGLHDAFDADRFHREYMTEAEASLKQLHVEEQRAINVRFQELNAREEKELKAQPELGV